MSFNLRFIRKFLYIRQYSNACSTALITISFLLLVAFFSQLFGLRAPNVEDDFLILICRVAEEIYFIPLGILSYYTISNYITSFIYLEFKLAKNTALMWLPPALAFLLVIYQRYWRIESPANSSYQDSEFIVILISVILYYLSIVTMRKIDKFPKINPTINHQNEDDQVNDLVDKLNDR